MVRIPAKIFSVIYGIIRKFPCPRNFGQRIIPVTTALAWTGHLDGTHVEVTLRIAFAGMLLKRMKVVNKDNWSSSQITVGHRTVYSAYFSRRITKVIRSSQSSVVSILTKSLRISCGVICEKCYHVNIREQDIQKMQTPSTDWHWRSPNVGPLCMRL